MPRFFILQELVLICVHLINFFIFLYFFPVDIAEKTGFMIVIILSQFSQLKMQYFELFYTLSFLEYNFIFIV